MLERMKFLIRISNYLTFLVFLMFNSKKVTMRGEFHIINDIS